MSNHSKVSLEELDALFPQTEVTIHQMSRVEKKSVLGAFLFPRFGCLEFSWQYTSLNLFWRLGLKRNCYLPMR
jgi:hypothetical protein